jgi:hypothetical protein
MHAQDVSIALLTQALERVDEEGVIISFEERRLADNRLEGERVGRPSEGILQRSQYLAPFIKRHTPLLWSIALQSPALGAYTRWVIITLSCVFGIGVQSLGNTGLFHVLSPALLGLIIWNFISISLMLTLGYRAKRRGKHGEVYSQSLIQASRKTKRVDQTQVDIPEVEGSSHHLKLNIISSLWRLSMWVRRKWVSRLLQHQPHYDIQLKAFKSYTTTAGQLFAPMIAHEVKRTLHFSAAAFALGVLGSAYWDGLIQSYHATAASTFLTPSAIEAIVHVILLPSRLLWGEIPQLIATINPVIVAGKSVPQPTLGLAAPWVHHYAISVSCWVVMPRLLLAARESLALWYA